MPNGSKSADDAGAGDFWRSITAQVWVLVVLCAVFVGGLVAMNTRSDLARERTIVSQQLEYQGAAQRQALAVYLRPEGGYAEGIEQLASQPALRSLRAGCGAALDSLQHAMASLGAVLVVDARGVVRCAGGDYAARTGTPPYGGLTVVRDAIAAGKSSMAGPFRDPVSGELSLAMVMPMHAQEPAALLYSYPTQASLELQVGNTDVTSLLFETTSGTVLMHQPKQQGAVGARVQDLGLGAAAASPGELTSATGPDGVRRLYRTLEVTGTGFRLLIGEDEAEAFAAARRSLRRNGLIGGGLVLVVGLMGLLLQRRVARPARALRQAIVSLGADPNAAAAPTDGPTELAEVARAFNSTVEARRRADGMSRAIVEHASDLLVVLSEHGKVTYLAPAARRLIGSRDGESAGSLAALVHPDDRERMQARVAEWLQDGNLELRVEARVRDTGGDYHHLDVHLQDLRHDPYVTGVVLSARDVTDRKRFEQHLAHQARHDPLTGLFNRTAVLERLSDCLDLAGGDPAYVFFIDLDRFKLVNDSHGHSIGDLVLIALADRLTGLLADGDLLGRFGGDEFVLVARSRLTVAEAYDLAQAIRDALGEPLVVVGREMFISGSVGIALGEPGDVPEVVLRNADTAMYRAKADGRNCVALYDEAMRAEAQRLRHIENDLHRAIERGQLRLHFQPVVTMADERVVGVEALVRWEHPERGLMSPMEFIPVAEETGLVVPLGAWVLEQACEWAAAQQDEMMRVSVNVSPRQLAQPDVITLVGGVLARTGLAPERLCLEVTESLLVQDAEAAAITLRALHEFGVRLSIDDFGTGWSSLTYLQQFPVDEIKLDRSYVSKVGDDSASSAIVGALISMAHSMDLTVTAEGVETREQAEFLRDHGCDTAQGYLFARPLPVDRLAELLGRARVPLPRQSVLSV